MPASCASRSSVQSKEGSRCNAASARPTAGSPAPASQPVRPSGSAEQIAPQHFGEQHLGQVRQDHLASRSGGRGLRHGMPQHVVQPFAGRIRADIDAHDARQARQHRLEQLAVAGEIAAHQSGLLTTAAEARKLHATAPQRGQRVFTTDGPSSHACAHFVRIAVRHHHDVTGGQRRGLVAHANVRSALGDVMELDDARGLRADVRQEGARRRRLQAPGSGATRVVEQGAGKFYGAQEF